MASNLPRSRNLARSTHVSNRSNYALGTRIPFVRLNLRAGDRRSGESWDELRVAIQKRQYLFLYIDIRTSDTKYYSLDA